MNMKNMKVPVDEETWPNPVQKLFYIINVEHLGAWVEREIFNVKAYVFLRSYG